MDLGSLLVLWIDDSVVLFLHSMVLFGHKLENLMVKAQSLVVGSLPILLPADSAQSASLSWIIRCLVRSRHQALISRFFGKFSHGRLIA